jgi:hypothetical protein
MVAHSGAQQDQYRMLVTYDEAIEILMHFSSLPHRSHRCHRFVSAACLPDDLVLVRALACISLDDVAHT